jgi:hypothetical protein
MRYFGFILAVAGLMCGCATPRLSDVDRAAIQALVEKENHGSVEEIHREPSGLLRVSTTKNGLYGVQKTQRGWVIVEHGLWIE